MTQPSLPGMAKHRPRPSTLPGAKRKTPERDEQQELIRWRDLHSRPGAPDRIEALGWLHSSLNGEFMEKQQAARAKASGMTAGVWDLFLPVARRHPIPEALVECPHCKTQCEHSLVWRGGEFCNRWKCRACSFSHTPAPVLSRGLYLEMKAQGRGLTAEQKAFQLFVAESGYQCHVCYSWIAAARTILVYLGVPRCHAAWQGLEGGR